MAIYRSVHLSFWTDNKVEDEFTPEDKYFYLYLLTNPQTNICGCYEVSWSQLTRQTGYNKDTVIRLLDRFENVHKIIKFNEENKEILIIHWHKYNWSRSKDTLKGVEKVAEYIKTNEFREYVLNIIECIKDRPPLDPLGASVSVSDTDNNIINSNNINNTNKKGKNKFNNFKQRDYSFDELEKKLLSKNR